MVTSLFALSVTGGDVGGVLKVDDDGNGILHWDLGEGERVTIIFTVFGELQAKMNWLFFIR